MNLKFGALFMTALLTRCVGADGLEPPLVDGFVNAPLSEVWRLFTSAEEYESASVNKADIDLRLGGHIRTHAGAGELGDNNTVDDAILAFDPQHMLALRTVATPPNFPYRNALAGTWRVLYFDSAGENMTRVRLVGLGFTSDPESEALRGYFANTQREFLDRVAKRYWPKCAHCELESPLTPEK
jgi:uncharacterized protein YndB with AHSA1/START domain